MNKENKFGSGRYSLLPNGDSTWASHLLAKFIKDIYEGLTMNLIQLSFVSHRTQYAYAYYPTNTVTIFFNTTQNKSTNTEFRILKSRYSRMEIRFTHVSTLRAISLFIVALGTRTFMITNVLTVKRKF